MAATMPELRTPVMIFVEAAWEDEKGSVQTSRACMEDKSAGGACIRLKVAVAPDSKIRIRWRFEEFFGVVKYCRSEGRDFRVGIQRDDTIHFSSGRTPVLQSQLASAEASSGEASSSEAPFAQSRGANARIENSTNSDLRIASIPADVIHVERLDEQSRPGQTGNAKETASNGTVQLSSASGKARTRSADALPRIPPRGFGVQSARRRPQGRDRPQPEALNRSLERPREVEVPSSEPRSQETPKQPEGNAKRNFMGTKWLARAPWNHREEEPAASGEGRGNDRLESTSHEKEKTMPLPQPMQTPEKPAPYAAREVPTFQVELLSMEDIYRTAGIVSPRKGYSITKIVEMLNSEHIRGLSKETKRAAILMALDAAGVTVEQVQRDARARQGALDAYENEQRKRTEAEWSRKAEEITHIQAELESIKAHYTARISRNMEALARDKARFNNWITTKEQESQSMAEAIELCSKIPSSEPAATAPSRSVALTTDTAKAGSIAASKPM